MASAISEHDDGGCGRSSNSRKRSDRLHTVWHAAAVLVTYDLRGAMEIARTRVIPETAPVREHIVERRRCQRADVRKARHESLVIGDYRCDLRLLQHDL